MKFSDQWLICPGIGIGFRSHKDGHGYNIDLTAYLYWDAGFSLYGKGLYLFYPKQEGFYLGVGAGVIGGYFYTCCGGGSPLIRWLFWRWALYKTDLGRNPWV